jgi:anhydro-N-acetylmuramic acid kinase
LIAAEYFIGLMSGTSLDGVDAVLVDFSSPRPAVIEHFYLPYPENLLEELLSLHVPGHDEINRAAKISIHLARIYAESITALLKTAGVSQQDVIATGCHGQTVRHQPESGYSIQLVDAPLLAELTGITVVSDFRSRDIAAGGQGAPLVPAFHAAMFRDPDTHRIILNIGGIANLTDLPSGRQVTGFDCGPGNMLMDAWIRSHRQEPYDEDGKWAAQGEIIPDLLKSLLCDDYFGQAPPKSTGRDRFNPDWLKSHLAGDENPADVQATLLGLTAASIASAIERHCTGAQEVYLCGGGAHNRTLREALQRALPGRSIALTDQLGIPTDQVEAVAFSWLARQAMLGLPGNLPEVTGAGGGRRLGAIHPA